MTREQLDDFRLFARKNSTVKSYGFNSSKTSGPEGKRLTQYFVCKKYGDIKPLERFEDLRKKNLCFQCLFSGADVLTQENIVKENVKETSPVPIKVTTNIQSRNTYSSAMNTNIMLATKNY